MSVIDINNFSEEIEESIRNLKNEVKQELIKIGEESISYARQYGNYQDRTGDLRASLGFAVTDDGVQHMEANEVTKRLILDNDTSGVSLILASGVHYARFVEAKNFDVLTGGYLLAESKING